MTQKARFLAGSVLSLALLAGPGCGGSDARKNAPGTGGDGGDGGEGGEGGTGGKAGAGGSGGRGGSGGSGGKAGTGGGGSGGAGGSGGSADPDGGAGMGGTGGSSGAGGAGGAGGTGGGGGAGNPADLASYKYAKPIKLDTSAAGANVMGDVANFPVAINLNAMNFDFAQAKDGGADLRFGQGTTVLPYAIEHWDKAGQTGSAWVKVPMVKGNDANQSITMYWGNAAAMDASDSKVVFDTKDGFAGVWHLAEEGNTTADGYKDATGNEAHATGVALTATSGMAGKIGKGTKVVNAMDQWIKIDTAKKTLFDTQNKMTISIWGKADRLVGRAPIGYDTIFSKGDSAWTIQRLGRGSTFETCVRPGGHLCAIGKTSVALNQWYQFVTVLDHPNLRFYVNGVQEDSVMGGGTWAKGAHPVGIGVQTQYVGREPRFWDGLVDEARIMTVSKDANWIKLDFESQKDGSKFLAFGPVEAR